MSQATPMAAEPDASRSLRDACVEAAGQVIAERGIEHLSLREVARKLGVSHQAPYRHYPSRDHLLIEVLRRNFDHFTRFLDNRPKSNDPIADLESMGYQYLLFVEKHPLEYQMMFSTPWPPLPESEALLADATSGFELLRSVLRRIHQGVLEQLAEPVADGHSSDALILSTLEQREVQINLDAIFIWSTIHGLAGVMTGPCIQKLALPGGVRESVVPHVMSRVKDAIRSLPIVMHQTGSSASR